MKFSFRQILASAGGAVLAAIIASLFGVKGTIIGVAIGSVAATSGTALVAKSIERGHQAVQQVVVRVPDRSSLLRRLGGTGAAGVTDHGTDPDSPLAEETSNAAVVDDTRAVEASEATAQLALPLELAITDAPRTAVTPTEIAASDTAAPPTSAAVSPAGMEKARGIRWPAIAGTAAVIFVLSLAFVTTVELIAGRPLADLFGAHVKGANPSIVKIFENPPVTTTTVEVPTTTTSSSTSTTTSSTSTTTSTTEVGTTSSTDSGSATTTTGGTSDSTTTTTSSPGQ